MKKVFFLMAGLIIFMVMQSCSASKKTTVVGKNAALNADFTNLKTYSWTTDIDKIPNEQIFIGPGGVYVFNNESGRKMIKDAIKYQLDARGYKMSTTNPDMLISFSVLEQGGRLRTTNGYVTLTGGEKVRTEDNISYKDVKPGTLIVNITNMKTGKMIWQGFASGILQADQMQDQAKVRQAVSSIFEEFNHSNNNYSSR